MRRSWPATAALALLATVAACGDDDALTCVEVDLTCQPLYEPTFDNVFANTLAVKCGTGGSTCHSSEGHQAGLILDDKEQAHMLLLEHDRVIPGMPSCSLLIERVYARSSEMRMPPGPSALSDPERCALAQWIANGAMR